MKDINELEKSFNELQSYSDSQFKSIVELKKQIKKHIVTGKQIGRAHV